jgi:hypothetical protein
VHTILEMVPSSDSLGNYYCMRTQPTIDSCPNFLGIPSHKPVAYLQEFGLLALFGHPFVDRPNYGSNEFRGKRAIAPRSERQIVTLNQR